MRFVFAALLILGLSQPAWASTIFFCSMQEFAGVEKNKFKQFKLENFRMAVSAREVQFGSGGFLNNYNLKDVDFISDEFFDARDSYIIMKYESPNLYISATYYDEVNLIYATCDKF